MSLIIIFTENSFLSYDPIRLSGQKMSPRKPNAKQLNPLKSTAQIEQNELFFKTKLNI